MAYILKSRTKSERLMEEKRAYHRELESKAMSKYKARIGRPGEREEYPALGKEYWDLKDEQAKIFSPDK